MFHSKVEQSFSYFASNEVLFTANATEISSNAINEMKGPNIFERAKDEMEALVHTIQHKKETDSPAKEGFLSKLGKCLEIICSPSKEKDD